MNTDILKRLDDAISSTLIGKSENPDCNVGAAICIIKDGKEVYRNEYGEADKEKHIPMEKNSIFRCYSMTKPVTSVAVMTLVEKGLIALSDPVSNFIPSFKNQTVLTEKGYVPAKREVVIQDLLNMTAGLTYPDASFTAGKAMQDMIYKYYSYYLLLFVSRYYTCCCDSICCAHCIIKECLGCVAEFCIFFCYKYKWSLNFIACIFYSIF